MLATISFTPLRANLINLFVLQVDDRIILAPEEAAVKR
jgi:hypothetical protein